jgi:hypothetical protein
MKISRFEDLDVWQKARELTKVVYRLTANQQFCRDFGLRDQMRRAAVSIMANIAEDFERKGSKEFRNKEDFFNGLTLRGAEKHESRDSNTRCR